MDPRSLNTLVGASIVQTSTETRGRVDGSRSVNSWLPLFHPLVPLITGDLVSLKREHFNIGPSLMNFAVVTSQVVLDNRP